MGVTVKMPVVKRQLADLTSKLSPVGYGSYITWLAGPAHQYLLRQAKDRIAKNEPGGGDWPDLVEATANWRTYYGYGPYAPINRRTGKLRDLMTRGAPRIGSDSFGTFLVFPGEGADRPDMQIRLKQAQGVLQQNNGRKATPRPVVVLTPQDMAALVMSFQKWVESTPSRRG